MSRTGKFLKAHLPWISIMLVITIQSSTSKVRLPDVGWQDVDKLVHFFVFGILGWFLARGMHLSEKEYLNKKSILFVLIFGSLFAFSDELHQWFTPGRYADWADWLADFFGILTFALLYNFRRRKENVKTA